MSTVDFEQDNQPQGMLDLPYLANTTASECGEEYAPSASGISADHALGFVATRFGNRPAWRLVLRALNESVAAGSFEIDQKFDDTANEATTEAFTQSLVELLATQGVAVTTDEEQQDRGIVRVTHERTVIFTKEFDLSAEKLRKWKPRIILDRRTLDIDDD